MEALFFLSAIFLPNSYHEEKIQPLLISREISHGMSEPCVLISCISPCHYSYSYLCPLCPITSEKFRFSSFDINWFFYKSCDVFFFLLVTPLQPPIENFSTVDVPAEGNCFERSSCHRYKTVIFENYNEELVYA